MASRSDHTASGRDWHELLAAVLLAVAAVATAWSSYQATRWHGEQALASSRTNAIRIEGARASSLAEAETEVDVATFIAWVDADRRGESALADFYASRFRPEFQTAFTAWIATNPFSNPDAPRTPFAMPEYRVAAQEEANRLDSAAEASSAEVRHDIQLASNYVLTVVVYAVVLFLAGMSTKFTRHRLRMALILSGYVVLAFAIAWVATFPISLSI